MSGLLTLLKIGEEPWGFRLTGGRDFGTPLTVLRVSGGSVAEEGGMEVGDMILSINNENATNLTHAEAQNLVLNSGNRLEILILRGNPVPAPDRALTPSLPFQHGDELPLTASKVFEVFNRYEKYEKSLEKAEAAEDEDPTEDLIKEKMLENAELLDGKVIGVNFKRFIPTVDFIKNSLVYQALQDEQVHEPKSEEEVLEKCPDKRFSTFLCHPTNIKPKAKKEVPKLASRKPKNPELLIQEEIQLVDMAGTSKDDIKLDRPSSSLNTNKYLFEVKFDDLDPTKESLQMDSQQQESQIMDSLQQVSQPEDLEKQQDMEKENLINLKVEEEGNQEHLAVIEEINNAVKDFENSSLEINSMHTTEVSGSDQKGTTPDSLGEDTDLTALQKELCKMASNMNEEISSIYTQLSALPEIMQKQINTFQQHLNFLSELKTYFDKMKKLSAKIQNKSAFPSHIDEFDASELKNGTDPQQVAPDSSTGDSKITTDGTNEKHLEEEIVTDNQTSTRVVDSKIGTVDTIDELPEPEEQPTYYQTMNSVYDDLKFVGPGFDEDKPLTNAEKYKTIGRKKRSSYFQGITPQTRPVVLPGGRIWRKPEDAYKEEFFRETIVNQAEVLVGNNSSGINYRKYEAPKFSPSESNVLKLINTMENKPIEDDSASGFYQAPIDNKKLYMAGLKMNPEVESVVKEVAHDEALKNAPPAYNFHIEELLKKEDKENPESDPNDLM